MLNNRYLKDVYDGCVNHRTIKQIHKKLLETTLNMKKVKSNRLLSYYMKVSNKVVRQKIEPEGFLLLFSKLIEPVSKKVINTDVQKHENDRKLIIMENAWKQNRVSGTIFYVASAHGDCAEDHLPYQGKIYVDRYWHNYDYTGEIADYINRNNIKTVQWVTGAPAYFITRPHCRHYFVNYSFDDIRTGNFNVPYHKIGQKKMQTPAKATLEFYQDRLASLYAMKSIYQTDSLKNKISKTKILITKWKKMF